MTEQLNQVQQKSLESIRELDQQKQFGQNLAKVNTELNWQKEKLATEKENLDKKTQQLEVQLTVKTNELDQELAKTQQLQQEFQNLQQTKENNEKILKDKQKRV